MSCSGVVVNSYAIIIQSICEKIVKYPQIVFELFMINLCWGANKRNGETSVEGFPV